MVNIMYPMAFVLIMATILVVSALFPEKDVPDPFDSEDI